MTVSAVVSEISAPIYDYGGGRAVWVCYHEIACIDPHQTGSVGAGSDHLQLIKL